MTLQTRLIDHIYRVATGSRSLRNFFTPVGATFYGLVVCAFVFAGVKADRLAGIGPVLPFRIGMILSPPIFGAGVLLIGWSVFHFVKAKGSPVPLNPPPRLVTSGPYTYTRNPMLTGVFALLAGFGVLFGSVFLLLVFAPLFIALNYLELKYIEEPELEKRLGSAYAAYRSRTPMFFPSFRRKGNCQ